MGKSQISPEGEDSFSASPVLRRHIEEINKNLLQVEKSIDSLRREEDRVRHSLGNERRRREKLESEAAKPDDRDTAARSQLALQIEQASGGIERLQDELKRVRSELAEAEADRDRLRRDLADLEVVNASINDQVYLHFQRAEFEKQRYERSEQTNTRLVARLKELEESISRCRGLLAEQSKQTSLHREEHSDSPVYRWLRRFFNK